MASGEGVKRKMTIQLGPLTRHILVVVDKLDDLNGQIDWKREMDYYVDAIKETQEGGQQ